MATFAQEPPQIKESREVWPVVMERDGWFYRKGWKAALVLAAFLFVGIAGWWAWQDIYHKEMADFRAWTLRR